MHFCDIWALSYLNLTNEFLCAKDVATTLGCSERTAARLMARGAISSFNFGPRLVRATKREVQEYVRSQFLKYRRGIQAPKAVLD